MIRILQSISARERLMLAAFIAVCILIWASSLSRRWDESGKVLYEARKEVKQQEIWLKSSPLFQAQLEQATTRLDREQMLDGSGLTAFVDAYSREHQLKHQLTSPQVVSGKVYTRSTVQVTFRNISLADLIGLQLALDEKRPYIAVEKLALSSNRADPRLLNARLSLTALYVNPPAQNAP
ncbi:hypothetical protein H5P28_17965 [Ruficoccus amylovorans]|uniref:General secretion pathway protein GspM n=1 Tax=Ruficoccus amylovorans TaxID=1804625 RepID=A0A842HJL9_9BACT|nr:hypothetical protein [Ruficoccus amylovorans]MBC2596158.1 hypothetical protein [Ruficoccus amylovorans]